MMVIGLVVSKESWLSALDFMCSPIRNPSIHRTSFVCIPEAIELLWGAIAQPSNIPTGYSRVYFREIHILHPQ